MSNWITTNQTYGNWTSGQIHLTQEIRSPNRTISRTPPPSPPLLPVDLSRNTRILPPLTPPPLPPLPRSLPRSLPTTIPPILPPPPGLNRIPSQRRINISSGQRIRIRNLSRISFPDIEHFDHPITIKQLNNKTEVIINKELEDRYYMLFKF